MPSTGLEKGSGGKGGKTCGGEVKSKGKQFEGEWGKLET